MPARAFLGSISSLEQSNHVFAVFLQHCPVVAFWPSSLSEPPDLVYCTFDSYPPDVDPFSRSGNRSGIIPIEVLSQMKTQFLNEGHKQLSLVDTSSWSPFIPNATRINHQTTALAEDTLELFC